jgi:fatty-acid desaturase
VDFVLAYPQAPIEFDMYINLPNGIQMASGDRNNHVLKLLKNMYGQKQAGRVWNKHLISGLFKIGFVQTNVDECVFYIYGVIFMVYVDDGIFFCTNMGKIDQAILHYTG